MRGHALDQFRPSRAVGSGRIERNREMYRRLVAGSPELDRAFDQAHQVEAEMELAEYEGNPISVEEAGRRCGLTGRMALRRHKLLLCWRDDGFDDCDGLSLVQAEIIAGARRHDGTLPEHLRDDATDPRRGRAR